MEKKGVVTVFIGIIFLTTLWISSCKKDDGNQVVESLIEEGEELLGGQATIFDKSQMAFALPVPALTNMQELDFGVGNSFFNQAWVTAPASTKARDGVGPIFNARSCSGCHFKDGRGKPLAPGQETSGFLIRLSIPGEGDHGGPLGDPMYGGQLQNLSIVSADPEGHIEITYEEIEGKYADGASYSLRKPTYAITGLNYGPMHPSVMMSPRVAPQMIGLGLLEAISEETLLRNVDEMDRNGDGISGRANYVWDVREKKKVIGRFGWKANQPNIYQQSAGAFNGDMGLTTSIFPDQNITANQVDLHKLPNGGEPEVLDVGMDDVYLYSSALAVPARRDWKRVDIQEGKRIFRQLNCNGCHIEKIQTAKHPKFKAFDNQTIRPYTDLLLHDMGEGLADHRPDFLANGNEWKTPPLWGIGLFKIVNRHTYYLHDGRARNLEEAILWHGGEAQQATDGFKKLTKTKREALIAFLNDL